MRALQRQRPPAASAAAGGNRCPPRPPARRDAPDRAPSDMPRYIAEAWPPKKKKKKCRRQKKKSGAAAGGGEQQAADRPQHHQQHAGQRPGGASIRPAKASVSPASRSESSAPGRGGCRSARPADFADHAAQSEQHQQRGHVAAGPDRSAVSSAAPAGCRRRTGLPSAAESSAAPRRWPGARARQEARAGNAPACHYPHPARHSMRPSSGEPIASSIEDRPPRADMAPASRQRRASTMASVMPAKMV